jgi:signal transduction histidine kinase
MRRRILLLVVGMTALVVLAFAIPVAILVRDAVGRNAERDARTVAGYVAQYLRSDERATLSRAQITSYVQRETADTGYPISVTFPDGSTVGSVPVAEDGERHPEPSYPGDRGGAPPGDGDRDVTTQLTGVSGGQLVVAVAPGAEGPYLVRVYLSEGQRFEGLTKWLLLIAAGSVGLLLIGVLAGEWLTRRITRPLVRTAQTAQRLAIGDTTARAPTDGPREVADVGEALNRLADRIDELIAEERETVADLSHRLRTPLTTLRLDAESLHDPAEAERVGAHVSVLERMLTAVIHAARRPQREGRLPVCDATAVVGARIEFWSALTDEQGRRSEIVLPSVPMPVRASSEDLAAALDALLENVVAHTPEGTAFAVRLTATPTGARLEIADEGPGIPLDAEVRGRSDRGSTGLGLDIARRCAEASGGSMSIDSSPSGGASVTLELRAP